MRISDWSSDVCSSYLITQLLGADKLVFAYSMAGLFTGYVYFSIPRVILTVMAATEKLDPKLEEAPRSLGASPLRFVLDVIIPGLKPAFLSSGAICFATAVGAFGTAFTLATRINVLPMTIYTEFTLSANIAMAAALSFVLGAVTWAVLALARTAAGTSVAARSEEHTSELQSLMRISYAVFCLQKKKQKKHNN